MRPEKSPALCVRVSTLAPGKRTKMMGVGTGDGTWLTDRELQIMWFALLNWEGTTRYLLFSPPGEGAV